MQSEVDFAGGNLVFSEKVLGYGFVVAPVDGELLLAVNNDLFPIWTTVLKVTPSSLTALVDEDRCHWDELSTQTYSEMGSPTQLL